MILNFYFYATIDNFLRMAPQRFMSTLFAPMRLLSSLTSPNFITTRGCNLLLSFFVAFTHQCLNFKCSQYGYVEQDQGWSSIYSYILYIKYWWMLYWLVLQSLFWLASFKSKSTKSIVETKRREFTSSPLVFLPRDAIKVITN